MRRKKERRSSGGQMRISSQLALFGSELELRKRDVFGLHFKCGEPILENPAPFSGGLSLCQLSLSRAALR